MVRCPHCSMLSTTLNNIVDLTELGATMLNILLTTLNKMGSTTLLNLIFINLKELNKIFLPCTAILDSWNDQEFTANLCGGESHMYRTIHAYIRKAYAACIQYSCSFV